jgi:2-oxoglutarate ferredoxin oxidoreductase subunit gamma
MAQTDLTIAGVGGQGSILAGVILGSAAVIFDGKRIARRFCGRLDNRRR